MIDRTNVGSALELDSPPAQMLGGRLRRIRKRLDAVVATWTLVQPRAWTLAAGLLLLLVSRVATLVIPGSSKFLIDNVLRQQRIDLLPWIVGSIIAASIVQGVADMIVAHLLSGEASRLIAKLRC